MKPRKFKRRNEVAVDEANFAKWDVNIPPNCAAITNGGVVLTNNSSDQWVNLSVFTLRDHQVFKDFKQIDINEKIEELLTEENENEEV